MAIGTGAKQTRRLLEAGDIVPEPVEVQAMVDTGTRRSVIDPELASVLGLERMGTSRLSNSSSEGHEVPAYDLAAAILHRGKRHWLNQDLRAIGAPIRHGGFHILLGMDLLSGRLLTVDGKAGVFTLRT